MKKRYYVVLITILISYAAGIVDFNRNTYVTLRIFGLNINLTNKGSDNVHFSDEYIEKNKGKVQVEIPEVHELINIMIAISEVGRVDSNMINNRSTYHKEVLAHFLPFSNHSAIEIINQQITLGFNDYDADNKHEIMNSYRLYNDWKMSACAYLFDEGGSIVNNGIIRNMRSSNPVEKNLTLLEDFAVKSGFRDFYKSNKNYYDGLITVYGELNPVDEMISWLESQFDSQYESYRITFSPLVGGSHSTKRFSNNGFTQNVMFVSKATYNEKVSKSLNELAASRVIFTEIDHNFVNPISNEYGSQITKALSNRNQWVDDKHFGVAGYKTPVKVFNEYMTWATYTLYAYDNFKEDDFENYIHKMENQMENGRGFVKFKEFNQMLFSLYKNKPETKKVVDLYPEVINWFSKQNNCVI